MRILLVYDVDGWTWHRRAQDLQAFAPPEYQIDIATHTDASRWTPSRLVGYDGIFNFSWTMSNIALFAHAKRSTALVTCGGLLYDKQVESDWRSKVVTASRNTRRARQRLPKFDGLIAVNREGYEAAKRLNPNTTLIPSGINTDFYTPGPPSPVTPGKLTIGWCAQRRCNVKGQKEILEPLMKRLAGPEFAWVINDRNFNEALSREEMVQWYHGIDVLLCTSIIEGTPSPVFEAASCERCVLSTKVGMVADWRVAKQLDLRAPAYSGAQEAAATIERLAWKLADLQRNPEESSLNGRALRQSLFGWCDYRTVAPKYLRFIGGEPDA